MRGNILHLYVAKSADCRGVTRETRGDSMTAVTVSITTRGDVEKAYTNEADVEEEAKEED